MKLSLCHYILFYEFGHTWLVPGVIQLWGTGFHFCQSLRSNFWKIEPGVSQWISFTFQIKQSHYCLPPLPHSRSSPSLKSPFVLKQGYSPIGVVRVVVRWSREMAFWALWLLSLTLSLSVSKDTLLLTPNPPRNITLFAFNYWVLAPRRFQFIKGTQKFRPAASWRLAKDKVETDRLYVCVCVCVLSPFLCGDKATQSSAMSWLCSAQISKALLILCVACTCVCTDEVMCVEGCTVCVHMQLCMYMYMYTHTHAHSFAGF